MRPRGVLYERSPALPVSDNGCEGNTWRTPPFFHLLPPSSLSSSSILGRCRLGLPVPLRLDRATPPAPETSIRAKYLANTWPLGTHPHLSQAASLSAPVLLVVCVMDMPASLFLFLLLLSSGIFFLKRGSKRDKWRLGAEGWRPWADQVSAMWLQITLFPSS